MNLLLPGMYIAANSPIHRLDPRLKMVAATAVMVLPFAAPGIASQLVLAVFVLAVSLLALVPRRPLLRTLRAVFWIGCFMFAYQALTTPGEPVLHWERVTVTWAGLSSGAGQVYRLCLLVITAALLTYTTSPSQLTHGLESMLSPLSRIGLPVRDLALVMTIALRFVPTIAQEIEKIQKAQRIRGIDPTGNPVKRIQSWVPMFVPIFVSAFRRADQLAVAMEARGFRGTRQRTRLNQLHLSRRDCVAAGIVLATTVIVWVLSHI